MKLKTIKLTTTEINYLIELVNSNIDDGMYWGIKKHFEARQKNVLFKLNQALVSI